MDREELIKRLTERMYSRLSEIIWGMNAKSLQEALSFHEDWLFQDFARKERKQAINLLVESEFVCNLSFQARMRVCVWRMPQNPNEFWREVKSQYENSWVLATREFEENIEQKLINFFNSKQGVLIVDTKNALYRELLVKKIGDYNRMNMRKVFNIPTNLLRVQHTAGGEYTYISKGPQVQMYVDSQNSRHFETVQMMAEHLVRSVENSVYFNKNNKILYSLPGEYIGELTSMLKPFGVIVDAFPRFPEGEYAQFGYINAKSINSIPVYIILHHLRYEHDEKLSTKLNMTLQKLCSMAKF